LKAGEITEPIKQANGFYIFKLDEMVMPPYDQVRDDIYKNIKNERLTAWLDSLKKGLKIEFKDEKYLSEKAPRQ
jgi:parvulin-like peptidyl-prolyl isomerase